MPRITKKKKPIIDLIQDFLDYCMYKNLSKKTLKSYNQTLMLFMMYLQEERNIDDIHKVDKEIVQEHIQFTKERIIKLV
ncbi:MAG: site-specific integrase [Clostridium butyricum]|uniref:site-specific integrase n=1 Tax=Clostridium sp. TaxID=1506 RepID=UPI002902F1B8|nr:site-specific integrase [Clostridium sp.]MDU1116024.1 site-specific integrase [Clostridium sp.]MDU7712369.1 site-specific integrase [Clostridium butyricum]